MLRIWLDLSAFDSFFLRLNLDSLFPLLFSFLARPVCFLLLRLQEEKGIVREGGDALFVVVWFYPHPRLGGAATSLRSVGLSPQAETEV